MLSKRLKIARNNKKLTQDELAKKLSTTKATINNYENGHSSPSNDMLVLLSNVLHITTDYLLGKNDDNKSTNTVIGANQDLEISIEEIELFNELKKHPIIFRDLASDPEKKVKEMIKLYKMKKIFLEDEEASD